MINNIQQKTERLFTQPDSSLILETLRDPLGIQVIWSHFGKKVFRGFITSRTTDIMHFTLTIFIHYIIKKAFECPLAESIKKNHRGKYKTDVDLKSGLIIFLEDLIIMACQEAGGLSSLPGTAKYRRNPKRYDLAAEKSGGILTRQIFLGLSGRYKAPLMETRFFNRKYDYNIKDNPWAQAESMFSSTSWPEAADLVETLLEKLDYIAQYKGEYKEWFVQKNGEQIGEKFIKCFTREKVIEKTKPFWIKKLGLDKGAASTLCEIIEEGKRDDVKEIVLEGINRLKDKPDEREKLENIVSMEPFLVRMMWVFYLVTQNTTKRVSDVEEQIKKIMAFKGPGMMGSKLGNLIRLNEIVEKYNPDRMIDFIKAFREYHAGVMDIRQGDPWFTVLDDGKIRHTGNVTTWFEFDEKELEGPAWMNSYYVSSIRAMFSGKQGKQNEAP